jgi:hypothetical protein
VAIGTGSKTFATQSDLAFDVGARARVAYATDPANNWMEGLVTNYAAGSIVIDVDATAGSGTYANWNLAPAGSQGPQGIQGIQGVQGETGPAGPTGIYGTPTVGRLTKWHSATEIENSNYAEADLLIKAGNLSGIADAATARTNIGAAPLASPAFSGSPTAPNVTYPDNTTKVANTNFVTQAIGSINPSAFPSGTRLLFQQTAAPTGWTKVIDHNDKALRLVNGTVGTGGNIDFSTAFGRTATDGHALTIPQMPAHSHQYTQPGDPSTIPGTTGGANSTVSSNYANTETTSVGSGTAHSHTMDMRVRYVDVIIASKD